MKFNIHAGHNPDKKVACGAVGLIKESTEARKVAKLVRKYLKSIGHTVYDCTCNNGISQDNVLTQIVSKCNKNNVDLDISIHFNSGAADEKGNGRTTGVEVLVYDIISPVTDTADNICEAIAKLGFKNRGVKERPELRYLKQTKSPAVLIECCFVDDQDDVKIYDSEKMAKAITLAILNSYTEYKCAAIRNINEFDKEMNKVGKVKKDEVCIIDKIKFNNDILIGRRKKAKTWIKLKFTKRT